eukprot:CAMPEP_0202892868 /NCGR_PEP_ID=MMETSP1392-20130828/2542_1 /ASSEMBLY_ACC=CAM_ASM_000868 /TAXON_ID=225041 /ORGANISM="Chlamydomonas chlamydogama, Strain SAG 11-48b" /LENGTH=254 /DNA_ID=CAMNT_0049576983 /DNA_START=75 /DNA_END=839 /DNA_ORIENTATION=-
MASVLCSKSAFAGATAKVQGAKRSAVRAPLVVRAQKDSVEVDVSRRATLASLAGAAALLSGAAPSFAAYGDAANVFGRKTNQSGFVPYAGEGFALLLPSKWNPSKEKDFPGVQLRYEDNFDAVNNFVVVVQDTDKKSIADFGAPEKFLESVSYLFGKQSYSGETVSEGGFAPNRVSAASLLDIGSTTDKKGTQYYKYEILVRTADGDEGGRHQLIKAGVSGGKLYILKVQIGDKRWFKGAKKEAFGLSDSFTLA